jgi:pyruvate ferredoxin oxidoreductase alpha subunit
MQEVIDKMREDGVAIGALTLRSFRPFPTAVLRSALEKAKRIVVFEKCLAVGMGGIVSNNVRMALREISMPVYSVIGGLGGRPITQASLHRLFTEATQDTLEDLHFLDLNKDIVKRELEREASTRRSGSIAENILRDIGIVDAAKTI